MDALSDSLSLLISEFQATQRDPLRSDETWYLAQAITAQVNTPLYVRLQVLRASAVHELLSSVGHSYSLKQVHDHRTKRAIRSNWKLIDITPEISRGFHQLTNRQTLRKTGRELHKAIQEQLCMLRSWLVY